MDFDLKLNANLCWVGNEEYFFRSSRKGKNYFLIKFSIMHSYTRKKSRVDPEPTDPYLIFVCFAKSSADEIGESIRSTVRKAAKLAV